MKENRITSKKHSYLQPSIKARPMDAEEIMVPVNGSFANDPGMSGAKQRDEWGDDEEMQHSAER